MLFCKSASYGQKKPNDSTYVISKISIKGNRRTKDKIILRELTFSTGDTILHKNKEELQLTEERIFNTGLFITTKTEIVPTTDSTAEVVISVKERFYTYPLIIFELADRNFNEWWEQRDRDLNRINYGGYLVQKNMRGRNETLKLRLQWGFTRKAEIFYSFPYIQKNQRGGLNLSFSYIFTRFVPYTLDRHKLVYFNSENLILKRLYTGAQYVYRNKFYNWHHIGLEYHHQSIADTVSKINENYFGNGKTRRNYFQLSYVFTRDKRNLQYYATKGSYLKAEVIKTGVGIFNDVNILSLRSDVFKYLDLGQSFFYATGITGRVSFPDTQPFYNERALGYGTDIVRGYELFVINGEDFGLWKNSLKYRFVNRVINVDWFPFPQFSTIPLGIFLTANFDVGYVNDEYTMPGNRILSNQLLPGGGPGIDFVTYYDSVLRLEYSFNILGENGFFIHFESAIGGKK